MKRLCLACGVFRPEITALLPQIPDAPEIAYLEMGEHLFPGKLRDRLQTAIDGAEGYDEILLAYGLCGLATEGLRARRAPLVLPRSHDCGGILLGHREKFAEIFRPMPSTPFSSAGIIVSGELCYRDNPEPTGGSYEQLVREYGEDNARYVWEAMHPRLDGELQPVYWIDTVPAPEAKEKCRALAAAEGRPVKDLGGDTRLLRMLLTGVHPADEFLTVPPGATLRQTGDWDEIFRAVP